jgi:hypothetical protein
MLGWWNAGIGTRGLPEVSEEPLGCPLHASTAGHGLLTAQRIIPRKEEQKLVDFVNALVFEAAALLYVSI